MTGKEGAEWAAKCAGQGEAPTKDAVLNMFLLGAGGTVASTGQNPSSVSTTPVAAGWEPTPCI